MVRLRLQIFKGKNLVVVLAVANLKFTNVNWQISLSNNKNNIPNSLKLKSINHQ